MHSFLALDIEDFSEQKQPERTPTATSSLRLAMLALWVQVLWQYLAAQKAAACNQGGASRCMGYNTCELID